MYLDYIWIYAMPLRGWMFLSACPNMNILGFMDRTREETRASENAYAPSQNKGICLHTSLCTENASGITQ